MRNIRAKRLLRYVITMVMFPSDTGYRPSTVISKKMGTEAYTNIPMAMQEIYRLAVWNHEAINKCYKNSVKIKNKPNQPPFKYLLII